MGNIVGGTFFVGMLYYYLYGKEMERRPRPLALVGIGRLGGILLNHLDSQRREFYVEAGFDTNASKIERTVADAKIYRPEQIARIIRKNRIRIGMITAPAEEAQQAADLLVISGIKGILNLSGSRIIVPSGVETKDIDLGSRPEAALN
ncbi:Redox-sensing transcriptional repressor Rex [subsurface metagenome]